MNLAGETVHGRMNGMRNLNSIVKMTRVSEKSTRPVIEFYFFVKSPSQRFPWCRRKKSHLIKSAPNILSECAIRRVCIVFRANKSDYFCNPANKLFSNLIAFWFLKEWTDKKSYIFDNIYRKCNWHREKREKSRL